MGILFYRSTTCPSSLTLQIYSRRLRPRPHSRKGYTVTATSTFILRSSILCGIMVMMMVMVMPLSQIVIIRLCSASGFAGWIDDFPQDWNLITLRIAGVIISQCARCAPRLGWNGNGWLTLISILCIISRNSSPKILNMRPELESLPTDEDGRWCPRPVDSATSSYRATKSW